MKEDIKTIPICSTHRDKRAKVNGGKKESRTINNLRYRLLLLDFTVIFHQTC